MHVLQSTGGFSAAGLKPRRPATNPRPTTTKRKAAGEVTSPAKKGRGKQTKLAPVPPPVAAQRRVSRRSAAVGTLEKTAESPLAGTRKIAAKVSDTEEEESSSGEDEDEDEY